MDARPRWRYYRFGRSRIWVLRRPVVPVVERLSCRVGRRGGAVPRKPAAQARYAESVSCRAVSAHLSGVSRPRHRRSPPQRVSDLQVGRPGVVRIETTHPTSVPAPRLRRSCDTAGASCPGGRTRPGHPRPARPRATGHRPGRDPPGRPVAAAGARHRGVGLADRRLPRSRSPTSSCCSTSRTAASPITRPGRGPGARRCTSLPGPASPASSPPAAHITSGPMRDLRTIGQVGDERPRTSCGAAASALAPNESSSLRGGDVGDDNL